MTTTDGRAAASFAAQTAAYLALVVASCWPWRALVTNEMDTVAAARQWADPGWLPADWYLQLDIPYRTPFNAIVGPVAAHWGLPAGAAFGRMLAYLAVAAALLALVRALRIDPWLAFAPLALYLGNQSLGAGEWVVGAAEAKAFAYPAAIGAVAAVVARRYRVAAALAGTALSFHVLVGAMHLVALAACVVCLWVRDRGERPSVRDLWPFALTGAWGLWTITRTVLDELAREGPDPGWDLYTEFRVPHHVLPLSWSEAPLVGWPLWLAGAVVVGLALLWKGSHRAATVAVVVLVATSMHLIGLALLSQGQIPLLRYYWFRLADTWVLLAAALAVAGLLTAGVHRLPRPTVTAAAIITGLLTAGLVLPTTVERREQALVVDRGAVGSEHGRLLRWVSDMLPREAVVVVDPDDQGWYLLADRAAWALYKSAPQSASDVVTWSERLALATGVEITGSTSRGALSRGQQALGGTQLAALRQAGATHYLARRPDTPPGATELHRIGSWAVFSLG